MLVGLRANIAHRATAIIPKIKPLDNTGISIRNIIYGSGIKIVSIKQGPHFRDEYFGLIWEVKWC